MKINEILKFNRDAFFDGAVQVDWFYDDKKRKDVAKSYVFHGKEYHGIETKNNLLDTAGYVKRIVEKLYQDKDSNRFLLTIAGYGTGKSHLGVTLGTLLSKDNSERQVVIDKITEVDSESGKYIKDNLGKRNLVITLNGMNDFNLNYQILKSAKQSLELNGIDTNFLEDVTKAYETAEHFIDRNYDMFSNEFLEEAKKYRKYLLETKSSLKKILKQNIRTDQDAFNIVNEIYKMITSNYIKWDEGISAGDILTKLNEKLCIEDNIFDNIVIIFDEFGRFIEYAGAVGVLAGEAGLQQIFEAVQNASKNILFIGLIQSDLNAYLARVEKSSNIIRYLGRYETSEKVYISSNLETILANLILKTDNEKFENTIGAKLNIQERHYKKVFESINRWLPNSTYLWKNKNLFDKVIKEGCYPLDPFTVWILANSAEWMQQRSTLTFAEEVFLKYREYEVFDEKLAQIYPIELIESKFLDELINAEEKGAQNSQNCVMFKNVLSKYGEKLSESKLGEKLIKVLEGILITNIAKFKFYDREDNLLGLKLITGMTDKIEECLNVLEKEFGIIAFDSIIKRFEFRAEGTGLNEYRNVFIKHKMNVKSSTLQINNERIREAIGLNTIIEPSFPMEKGIKTQEWNAVKKFIDVKELTQDYVKMLVKESREAINVNTPKGILLYLYCDSKSYDIQHIYQIFNGVGAFKQPIMVSILNDAQDTLKAAEEEMRTLELFTREERNKFRDIYSKNLKEIQTKVVREFTNLANKKMYLDKNGINKSDERQAKYYNDMLKKLYYSTIPFSFDGFDKKSLTKAQGYYKQILELFLNGNYTNKQLIQSLSSDTRNKLDACLREDFKDSWGVFTKEYLLRQPTNEIVDRIVKKIVADIEIQNEVVGKELLGKYLEVPYGMNLHQLNLIYIYILTVNKNIKITYRGKTIKRMDLINYIVVKGKYNMHFILECNYSMIELNSREKFEKIFNEIISNRFSENCIELKNKLDTITEDEEIDIDLQDMYSLALEKLRKGIEVEKRTTEEIQTFNMKIENLESRFEVYNALVIISNIAKAEKTSQGNDYKYSEARKKIFKEKINEVISIIKKLLPKELENLKFSIREVSEKENKYNQSSIMLKKLGLNELANQLTEKVKNNIEELNRIEEFKEINGKLDALDFEITTKNVMTYLDIVDYKNKLEKLLEMFSSPNVAATIRNAAVEKIEKLNNILKDKEEKIISKQRDILEDIDRIKTELDIDKILNNIENLEIYGIDNQDTEQIKRYKQELLGFKKVLRNLDDIKCNLDGLEKIKENILGEFGNSKFIEVCINNIMKKQNNIVSKEVEWKIKNLEIKAEEMTVVKCTQWLTLTNDIPYYIGEASMEAYKEKRNEVEGILAKNRIDGVIALFNELSISEKEKCLSELTKL